MTWIASTKSAPADELEALLRLRTAAAADLHVLMRQMVPDPVRWVDQPWTKASKALAQKRNAPAENPPAKHAEARELYARGETRKSRPGSCAAASPALPTAGYRRPRNALLWLWRHWPL